MLKDSFPSLVDVFKEFVLADVDQLIPFLLVECLVVQQVERVPISFDYIVLH